MNKLIIYTITLFLIGSVLSCSDPVEEIDNTVVLNAVEKLISPINKSTITIDDLRLVEKFEWQKAETSKGIVPDYEVIFFKENGTSSEAIYSINTATNSTSINHSKLSEIASKAGINMGESGTVKWTVRAYYESLSVVSNVVNEFVITLPKVKSEVTKLYITGSATEFGDDIADAMEFTKTSDSEFRIFTELKAGLSYNFISNIEGDDIRYFSVKNNKLAEDGSASEIMKSGVYRINVDISNETVSLREITDLSLYYAIKHRAISLQYEGEGIWKTVCLINFSQEQWGDETRYKFRMSEGNINKFIEKTSDSYFSMKESVISNHDQQLWDGVWSYSSNLKNKWAEVIVDMSNYTHSINAVAEDFSPVSSSWSDLANHSTSEFIKGFWNSTEKHFNNSISGTINRYDYWPEAHAIDVIIDAYLRSGDNTYKQIIYDFHEGVKRKNGNTFKNSFYDDMAWHGLAHLRAFEATQDTRYETSSRELGYVTFPETVNFRSGEDVSLLDLSFDFRGIDMANKWVLPITVVDNSSYEYQSHPRKNYAKAILRILPFNDFSGKYSGTALLNFVKGEEGSGSIVANEVTGYVVDEKTVFFYAGTIDEDRLDRANYKIFAEFNGSDTGGVINFFAENEALNFKSNKEASYRIIEEMDAVRPYLKRRYVIINNIDYEYSDYTSVPGSVVEYTVRGSLTLERVINTQIPDEDQAIEW